MLDGFNGEKVFSNQLKKMDYESEWNAFFSELSFGIMEKETSNQNKTVVAGFIC